MKQITTNMFNDVGLLLIRHLGTNYTECAALFIQENEIEKVIKMQAIL